MLNIDDFMLFDLDQIEAELAAGHAAQVQFDGPPRDPARPMLMGDDGEIHSGPPVDLDSHFTRLDALCAQYGPRLNVRFYGHYGDVFDGRVLRRIPRVRSLTVNCLQDADHLEEIGELAHLTELDLGVYEIENKGLLASLPLDRLTALTLEETATKALDLAPLADAQALRSLRLFGHRKNIAALGALGRLDSFAFNPVKGIPLDFINGMARLTALKLVLGGTSDLNAVALPSLRDLALTQVRGFGDLGDLGRFPALERLLAQDQQHLEEIRVGAGNTALSHIWLYNCRALAALPGLGGAAALKSLHAVRTALALDELDLPGGLTHLSLFGGRARSEAAERTAIERRGLIAEPHPTMPFFYK